MVNETKEYWSLYNQWPAVLRHSEYNWVDVCFMKLEFEVCKIARRVELTFGLLGLVVHLAIPYSKERSPKMLEIIASMKQYDKEHGGECAKGPEK